MHGSIWTTAVPACMLVQLPLVALSFPACIRQGGQCQGLYVQQCTQAQPLALSARTAAAALCYARAWSTPCAHAAGLCTCHSDMTCCAGACSAPSTKQHPLLGPACADDLGCSCDNTSPQAVPQCFLPHRPFTSWQCGVAGTCVPGCLVWLAHNTYTHSAAVSLVPSWELFWCGC